MIGIDERRPARAEESALLRAVGIITCNGTDAERSRSSRATATLVGSRRTILTAAHVFADEAGRRGSAVRFDPISDCGFRQYDGNGEVVVEARFGDVVFGHFRDNAGLPTEDWAVLTTTEPLPEYSAPLPFAGLSLDDLPARNRIPILTLAFHADGRVRRRTPLLSQGELFTVDYAGFRRLAHTADMGRMSSGAAIVHRTADGRAVVLGVHRAAATLGDYNLGVPIAGALEQALIAATYRELPDASQRIAFSPAAGSNARRLER